ncbi:response regulator transcription factor [Blautia liquoris]|uniref:Stage 0 sporulation protein A homolog n=1 Tax=Blautia liquoris TaxID=2779518 RepID=A0A7M2REB3_9FIRM|nr:LytTR family DNA-binding domain-containing protein [Blautia liquoris]QOV18646.1 response regulator transcription factor [Blautia liquoris]
MLKIILCDDDRDSVRKCAKLISGIAEKNQLEVMISCFESGESLLFHYAETPDQIDILYLDIMMNGMNGMEVAHQMRNYGCKAQIVFLTISEEYVYDAFDVNAVRYLLKGATSYKKFESTFLRAAKLAALSEDRLFTFEFDGETGVIPMRQISYFEIWQRRVTIHYGDEKTAKFYGRMEQLEVKLRGDDFVRSHRSFLVHLPYIAKFCRHNLILKTGELVPVGVTYMDSLKREFAEYITRFHVYDSEDIKDE